MSIIADDDYALRKQKHNNFLKVDQGFSGMVLFQNWDGAFISGYHYKNGRRLQRLRPVSNSSLARLECVTFTIDYYQKTCVGVYCSDWKYLYSRSWTTCTEVPGEDEEIDWIDDGTGGTGGGGGAGTGGEFPPDYPREETSQQQQVDTIALDESMNPCLSSNIQFAIGHDMNNTISKTINQLFGSTDAINLEFTQSYTMSNDVAGDASGFKSGTVTTVVIRLNANVLPYASKEYTSATIFHEAIHAILRLNGTSGSFDHTTMAATYITKMQNAMLEMYPTLTPLQAEALAWGGLFGTTPWTLKAAAEPARATEIQNTNHLHKTGVAGEPCAN